MIPKIESSEGAVLLSTTQPSNLSSRRISGAQVISSGLLLQARLPPLILSDDFALILTVIVIDEMEKRQTRNYATCLAQENRSVTSQFFKLPPEILGKIASFFSNNPTHEKMAIKHIEAVSLTRGFTK